MGVVKLGHKIYVSPSNLTDKEVTVNWKSNFAQRSRQYYIVNYTNQDQYDEESILFIQKDYIESFKNKKTSGDDFTVIVDGSFQYGQNKAKNKWWLVYHDKKCDALQWRFVSPAVQKLGSNALNFAGGIFDSYVDIDLKVIQGLYGDPHRNF